MSFAVCKLHSWEFVQYEYGRGSIVLCKGLLLRTLYPNHVDINSIPGKGNNLVHQSRLMVCVNNEGVRDLITFHDVDA